MKSKEKDEKKSYKLVFHTLSYFYREAFHYKPLYFLFIILLILVNAFSPFINMILPKFIIDELMGDRDLTYIVTIILYICIGNFIFNTSKNLINDTLGKYSDSFDRYFKIKLSYRTMDMDFEHTEDPKALEQISKAQTGMDWYSGGIHGLSSCFVDIIANIITLLGVIIVITTSSPVVLIVSMIAVLLKSIINSKANSINVSYFKKLVNLNRGFGYVYWQLSDFKVGKDVRLYGASDMILHKADSYNDDMCTKWKQQSRGTLGLYELDVIISAISNSLYYIYLGFLMIKRLITVGDFNMLSSSLNTFQGTLNGIIWNIQEIHKKSTFMDEYVTFMKYPDALEKGSLPVPKNGPYEFVFRNVGFKYPRNDTYVLKNINLTLSNDEHLSIVGLNGAGKTTLVKLLCRLYDVTEGEILLNGINIKKYDYEEYMNLFSVVFQDFKLFAFSIRDNILLDKAKSLNSEISNNREKLDKGDKSDNHILIDNESIDNSSLTINESLVNDVLVNNESLDNDNMDEKLIDLCKESGLYDKINSLEKGVDTIIYKGFDEDGTDISGGEAQKIAIARALYKNAPVVILDEPTAALDPVAEYEIYNHFDNLVGGKIALYISHRLSSCKFCDRIAVFSKDTIAEYGTHDELMKKPDGLYKEMFMAQANYYA